MKIINILSQETIDKIAAGEVVANPASVVKELVENAIDAGSTAISIEIKDGGLSYIRITDNGEGISKDMIRTAFLRHATSKIIEATDLEQVRSLGFRGEALSSIAAVSCVELITKTADELTGSRYIIEGAKEISLSEVGAPDGTTFIVRQLFYNTPARKKFLKSASTEGSYVFEVIEHLAIANPDVSFKLNMSGKEKLSTSGNGNLRDVIYQVYGRNIASNILDISYEDDLLTVNGFIGKSVLSRGNRAFEHFYVNKRSIISAHLSKAVEEGYYGYMMGHQFPFFILFLDFKKPVVDVNVHPAKSEVRIEGEPEISALLTSIVHERLIKREDIIDGFTKEEVGDILKPVAKETSATVVVDKSEGDNHPIAEAVKSEPATLNSVTPEPVAPESVTPEPVAPESVTPESVTPEPVVVAIAPARAPEPFEKSRIDESARTEIYTPKVIAKENIEQITFLTDEAIKRHRIVGQVFSTYWIIEYEDKMYIIDQHAAHEKVLFEQTMKRLRDNEMTSQQMSPPMMVSLSATDMNIFRNYKEVFEEIGFEIEEFGGNDLAISAIPGNMLGLDPKDLFEELLNDATITKASNSHEMVIDKVASLSCKAAVKGNNRLSLPEVDALIKDLLALDNPYHCPHGRPTMISFSEYELEKKFKRIL